jgi:hypothetical protein
VLERAPVQQLHARARIMNEPTTPKVLVVYFSRTGSTRKLAEAIASATDGDIEELRESRSRRGILGWLRSGYEGAYGLASHPLPLLHDLQNYQLVFVGTPTWNHALSSPVRGFLELNARALPEVALFATCTGRDGDEVMAQMTELLDRPPLSQLRMCEADVTRGPAVEVGEFVEHALVAWEKRHRNAGQTPAAQASG